MKFVPRSESTRQFIIETTAAIFNKKGYAGTSMSDLTEATGLTKGSIYGNFENKDAVALAAFDYNVAHMQQVIHEKIAQATTYKDKLLAYTRIFSANQNTGPVEGGCPLLNTGSEADDTHEALRKKVAQYFLSWKKEAAGIISKGIAAGEFHKNTDAEKTALAMIALIEGGILLSRVTKTTAPMNTVIEVIHDLVAGISSNGK